MTTVIFLDIDGVLRHEDFFKRLICTQTYGGSSSSAKFDWRSMSNLNRIIEETGAKVVISSSWRFGKKIEDLQKIFADNNFAGEIVDLTPIYSGSFTHEVSRGKEIGDWLADNPVESYCIIDDCNDILSEQEKNFVLVDSKHGLTEYDAEKAIQILSI